MDFTGPDEPPSFLYAQPLSRDRVFVEETVLIGRPEVPVARLQDRLYRRLSRLGVSIENIEHTEQCRIQMIGPQPVFGQRTVGFGAAAGMIHPATGYHLARLPATAARAAWSALWPAERRQQWALYRFGAKVLCELDGDDTRRFFSAFFAIEPALWSGFLSATLSPLSLARAMATVFSAASLSTRRQLLSAGASGSGLELLRDLSRL